MTVTKTLFLFIFIIILMPFSSDAQFQQFEIFATVPESVGNISFTEKGELVYSHHPFFEPKIRVVKYNEATASIEPFPNSEWNTPRATDDHYFSNVLGIRNDENGIIWILDMAGRNPITPKIVGWNTKTDELEKIYYLPKTAVINSSQPNDMVVDTKHHVFIIADEGIANGGNGSDAALIVVDMKTGLTRRILQGTTSTEAENTPTVIQGKVLAVNGIPLLVGCDGITADKNFDYLYYGPLNGHSVYRLKIDDLLNTSLSQAELSQKVERYSNKPNNGGMSIDDADNLYLTAVESNGISIISGENKVEQLLFTDPKLIWPDGVSYNKVDGYMYVSAAQVNLGAIFNDRINKSTAPFYIFRFKPLAKGVPFR